VQLWRRCFEARVLLRTGRNDDAAARLSQVRDLAPSPQHMLDRSEILLEAAGILVAAGHAEPAAELTREAADLLERKGAHFWAAQARALLDAETPVSLK
jgi:hypothetical protein